MVSQTLRRKTLTGALALLLALPLTGCVYVAVAGLGALGGYMISPDTVEGVIPDSSLDTVWETAIDIVSIMGVIDERNNEGNILLARIHGTKVTVTAYQMSHSTVKLSVKARKAFLPKSSVAQDVYIKIVDHLSDVE